MKEIFHSVMRSGNDWERRGGLAGGGSGDYGKLANWEVSSRYDQICLNSKEMI